MLKGSLENIAYSIKSIEPSTDKIKIDPTTGVLSVDKHHGFEIGHIKIMSGMKDEKLQGLSDVGIRIEKQ